MPIFLTNLAALPRSSGGTNMSRINTLVSDFLAKAQAGSEFGTIDNPQVYQSLIDLLSPYAGNAKIQAKIDNLLADKKKLEANFNSINQDKNNIDVNLNDGLLQIARTYYSNPQALIQKTAELYNSVYEYLKNEAIPIATKKAGISGNVPNDLINYAKQIQDKSNDMLRLANSYISGTGPQNPDSYGVFIQTNPDNGLPISIKIQPVSSLDTSMSGYKITNNVTYAGLPVYLNTVLDQNGDEYGAVASGDSIYKYVLNPKTGGGSGMLEGIGPQGKSGFLGIGGGTGFLGWGKTTVGSTELDWSGLKNFGADYVGIPPNSVLKDAQNNYYYIDNSGKTLKAGSKEAMGAYLQIIGKNKDDVNNRAFLVNSDFLQAHPWQETGADGKTVTRMINSNWSGGIGPIGPPAPVQQPKEAAAVELPAGPTSPVGYTGSFKSTTSASLKKEQPPKEYVGGQYDFKSLMQKGKQLFQSFIPKF